MTVTGWHFLLQRREHGVPHLLRDGEAGALGTEWEAVLVLPFLLSDTQSSSPGMWQNLNVDCKLQNNTSAAFATPAGWGKQGRTVLESNPRPRP